METPSETESVLRMLEDLEDLGYYQRRSPALENLLQEFRRHKAAGGSGQQRVGGSGPPTAGAAEEEDTLRALVAKELARADLYGIRTPPLRVHFVGWTFRFGLKLTRSPEAREILESSSLEESDKVSALLELLQRG